MQLDVITLNKAIATPFTHTKVKGEFYRSKNNNNFYFYQIFQNKLQQAILDEELTGVNEASDKYFQAFLNLPRALKTPAFFVNSFNNIELTTHCVLETYPVKL